MMNPDDAVPVATPIFYGKRYRRLAAAVDEIDSWNQHIPADIVIIPPEVDTQTDDEDIDDDLIEDNEVGLPRDVPGEVEIHYLDANDDSSSDEEMDVPLSILSQNIVKESTFANQKQDSGRFRKKLKKSEPTWTENIIDLALPSTTGAADRLEIVKTELKNFSALEVFEKVFDNEVLDLIVHQSNLYSSQKNNHAFFVSRADIKLFIAILLFTGYHKLPRERLYWSLDDDTGVPFVANCMSRNRFQEIKRFVHLADNDNLDKDDKMAKLRPLMNLLNQKFLQWGVFHKELSIDEAMVRYFGHHSSKQFIKGKPTRFGYKDWLLTSSTGYCYSFDTYCGAKKSSPTPVNKIPLGSAVVLDLLENIAVPSDHIVIFDNYFTGYDLLKTLRERGQRATGTIRDNRTRKCPFSNIKSFQQKERGYYEHRYDSDSQILFVRWKDNSVVTLATNYDNMEPVGKVKRWSTAAKDKIDVPQPFLFQNYNQHMGGVDTHDQAVSNYRINIRGKKWWWCLFTHMVNMSVVNAWMLHKLASEEKVDLLDFQRQIVVHYIKCFGSKSQYLKQRPAAQVLPSIRNHEGGHFPYKLRKQLRCVQCHLRATWACIKCQLTLCLERDCFIVYHSQ